MKVGEGGVLKFNTYFRREGCWEIKHIDTRGEGVSKKASKFNMYYLNGLLLVNTTIYDFNNFVTSYEINISISDVER